MEDGGDGFGPGDSFEFVAERLAGAHSRTHDYSLTNVYWLTASERVRGDSWPATAGPSSHQCRSND